MILEKTIQNTKLNVNHPQMNETIGLSTLDATLPRKQRLNHYHRDLEVSWLSPLNTDGIAAHLSTELSRSRTMARRSGELGKQPIGN